MNKIKNVFYLYKLDWKRIFSNPISAFDHCFDDFALALCVVQYQSIMGSIWKH